LAHNNGRAALPRSQIRQSGAAAPPCQNQKTPRGKLRGGFILREGDVAADVSPR